MIRLQPQAGNHGAMVPEDSAKRQHPTDGKRTKTVRFLLFSIKIAVCNTDDGTGLKDRQPQNRSKKGAATDRAVSANQLNFDEKLEGTTNVIQMTPQPGGLVYWYLCVYCEGDVVRAELSCPSSCESGFFRDFNERIILIGGDNDDSGVRLRSDAPNDDSGFEISVVRKKA